MNAIAIFIFTKENNNLLKECAKQFSSISDLYNIHVIDDSFDSLIIKENKNLALEFGIGSYLGRDFFLEFYNNNEECTLLETENIGTENWNLGTCRNFAIDFSKKMNYEKILLIDHDIINVNVEDLKNGFKSVNANNFISFKILGIPDDSIIGHLCNELEIKDGYSRMLSGGFLFLCPFSLKSRFCNLYNEDWILQLQEKDKVRIELSYTVTHNGVNPFLNYKNKIRFQELGEIIVRGLLEFDMEALKNQFLWKEIIEKRKEFLKTIENKTVDHKNKMLNEIIKFLNENYPVFSHSNFPNFLIENI